MMEMIMILVMVTYVGFVVWIVSCVVNANEKKQEEILSAQKDNIQEMLRLKNNLLLEKEELKLESNNIFALYDITREMTKTLEQEEMFEVFKNKLREQDNFEDCQLFRAEPKNIESQDSYLLVPLQAEHKVIGYLMVRGLLDQNKDKLMIMGHQLALALRRADLYQEIENIAITDSLTQMYSRRYLLERLHEEISRSTSKKMMMSVLMIDVDYFKKLNDMYGHLVGDQILHKIALVIKENIRGIDIAGRLGGEEFCVVLPETDLKGALYAAERIRKAVEETPLKAYDANIKSTISLGIATFPLEAKGAQQMIEKADEALYRAKKLGRNRVCSFLAK